MEKNDNIIDFLGDVADAIREKKGVSEPIAAQDFADEIRSIETDGMRYFDARRVYSDGKSNLSDSIWWYSFLIKGFDNGNCVIYPEANQAVAFAIEPDREVYYSGKTDTLWNFINYKLSVESDMYRLEDFPEITKEEFYDLTWEPPIISES